MFKLAWQLIYSQKKWLFLLVCITTLMIVTATLFQTITDTTEKYTVEQAQMTYGDFSGLLVDVKETRDELADKTVDIGEYGIEKAFKVGSTNFQLGFFDETAFQLAQLQLIEGDFPKAVSEIVVEEAYLQKWNSQYDKEWRIGEYRTIGKERFQLVGIIKNYSANWALNIDISSKYFGFPNIIQLEDPEKEKNLHSFLVKEMAQPETRNLNEGNTALGERYGLNYMINDQFYYKGLQQYKVMNIVKYFFLIAFLTISVISVVQILEIYYKKQDILYTLLKQEGASNRKVEGMKCVQILVILTMASIISLPFVYVSHQIMLHFLYEYDVMTSWTHLLYRTIVTTFILISIVVVLMISCLIIVEKHFSKWRIKKYKHIAYGLNLFVVTASLILFFTSFFIYKEEINPIPKKESIEISANRVTQTEEVNGYNVSLPPRKYISEDEVEIFRTFTGVNEVRGTVSTDDLKIVHVAAIEQDENKSLENGELLDEVQVIPLSVKDELSRSLEIEKVLGNNQAILVVANESDRLKNLEKIGHQLLMARSNQQGDVALWSYKIAEIKVVPSKNNTMKIIINGEKAFQSHLFQGYSDIEIWMIPTISMDEYTQLLKKSSEISALYNYGVLEAKDNPLSKLFVTYFVFSFIVSLIFSCLTVFFMLDRKLEEEGYKWGIYLSQGMSKQKVWLKLVKSIPCLWLQSVLISSVVLLILLINQNSIVHPIMVYTKLFLFVILLILVLFLVVSVLFYKKIKKISIVQLLKRGVLH